MNIIIEGVSTPAMKKFIVLDSIDVERAIDPSLYKPCTFIAENKQYKGFANISDMEYFANMNDNSLSVKVLAECENNEYHIMYVNGSVVKLDEAEEYVSDFDKCFESALSYYRNSNNA